MRKLYTFLSARALIMLPLALLLASSTLSAQALCGPVVEDFDNTSGSTAGFTGNFSYGMNGSNGYLTKSKVLAGIIYSITTPTYQLPAGTNNIGVGFLLGGTATVARIEVKIMFVSTLNGEMVTYFVGQFVPGYDPTTGMADFCRAVATSDLPGFPTNGKYRFQIDLTPNVGSGSAAQTITFDDFKTNGPMAQSPLPVNFIAFTAKKSGSAVQLTWKIAGEEQVDHYELERSSDGRNFSTIASVARTGEDTYNYTDASSNTTAYYRVRNVDKDGKYKYSSIARIANGKSSIVIKAFPQPVMNLLTVQHPTVNAKAVLTVNAADGRLVKTVVPATGSMQSYVDMSTLQKGLYIVRFDDGDGAVETMKIVKQ